MTCFSGEKRLFVWIYCKACVRLNFYDWSVVVDTKDFNGSSSCVSKLDFNLLVFVRTENHPAIVRIDLFGEIKVCLIRAFDNQNCFRIWNCCGWLRRMELFLWRKLSGELERSNEDSNSVDLQRHLDPSRSFYRIKIPDSEFSWHYHVNPLMKSFSVFTSHLIVSLICKIHNPTRPSHSGAFLFRETLCFSKWW